jgi:glycine/D-amino acid oxidase-like deaminating enzyme
MHLEQTDVVVVGGGISGVSTALALKSRGFDVVLMEQRFLAFGSSGRSLGAVWAHDVTSADDLEDLRATHQWYDELSSRHGIRTGIDRSGRFVFAETDDEAAALISRVNEQRAVGTTVEDVSPQHARRESGFVPDTAVHAVFYPGDARVDLAGLVRDLGLVATRLGVRTYEHTPVLRITRYGDEVTGVLTARGEVRASAVVWAAGPWVQQLQPDGITVPLEVVRVGMLQTQPTGSAFPIMATSAAHLAERSTGRLVFEETFVQSADGRLLIGSTFDRAGSLNPHLTADAAMHLIGAFHRRQPELGHLGVTGLWAGIVGMTADQTPIIDRVGGLYLNVGHSAGAVTGPVSGEHIAKLIAGETTEGELARFAIDRPSLSPLAEAD